VKLCQLESLYSIKWQDDGKRWARKVIEGSSSGLFFKIWSQHPPQGTDENNK
jgi:hypothetical protein